MAKAQAAVILRHVRSLVAPHAYKQASDRELLKRFVTERDEAAFTTLVRRHGPMVLNVCQRVLHHRQDAEDACQATFLVLARKATSSRWQDSVANWLYEVAYHLALKARTASKRRSVHEGRAQPSRPASDPLADITLRELQAVLDEELAGLPAKYRAPLILCCLEGTARDEAAQQLDWTLRTVKSRLERGRELLRARLTRRGLTLSAALIATIIPQSATQAALPVTLLKSTSNAAALLAAGKTAAEAVSAEVATLMEGIGKTMFLTKVKTAAAFLLGIGILSAGVGALTQWKVAAEAAAVGQSKAPEPPAKAPLAAKEDAGITALKPALDEKGDNVRLTGRVLDPDGKPLAGAKLLLVGRSDKPVELGTSAADGRFTVRVPKDPKGHYLVARADGAGIDFTRLEKLNSTDAVELRVVKDQAIRGRVIDTEGKPVVGVRVAAEKIVAFPNNSLDDLLKYWMKRQHIDGFPEGEKFFDLSFGFAGENVGTFFSTKTDTAGRFVLQGIGIERLVCLRFDGGGIAATTGCIANRSGLDPRPYNEATRKNTDSATMMLIGMGPGLQLHGPEVNVVAEAEKVIQGVVRDSDTGKGLSDVDVWLIDMGHMVLKAKTDSDGRYEIRGARKTKSYRMEVMHNLQAGYMPCQLGVPDTAGYQPVTANFRVKKGVIVTGRVIDKSTGKGIPNGVMAVPLEPNQFVKDYPPFGGSAFQNPLNYPSADDGTFRVVTVPGPVLLMAFPDTIRHPEGWIAAIKYKPSTPDPDYPKYFHKGPSSLGPGPVYYTRGSFSPLEGNACKVLEIKPHAGPVKQDLVLEPADVITIKTQDAAGRPLTGVLVAGLSPKDFNPAYATITSPTDSCSAYQVAAEKPRSVVFYHSTRKLTGSVTLTGDEKQPVVVKLGPTSLVKGRIVDAEGKPLAGVVVGLQYEDHMARHIHGHIKSAERIVTNQAGAFQFDEVIPGLPFVLTFRREKVTFVPLTKPGRVTVSKHDQPIDLGDLKLQAESDTDGEE